MVAALALPLVALGLLQVLHRLELWTMQPLPHDPPPPPGYVDPLEGSELLADLTPAAAGADGPGEVDDPDAA